jgi:GR25 family glycosyltransferase involved in LPS biosynthesis
MIPVKAYILHSPLETDRIHKVNALKAQFSDLTIVRSIYPSETRIPFLNALIQRSAQRTGTALRPSEIACLLGHRRIWHQIANASASDSTHFLVMESDSQLISPALLETKFDQYTQPYDLFFWGAWEGNLKIKRSSILFKEDHHIVGEPLINTAYCMYGYSLNKKAAKYLLTKTRQVSYPVDFFKKFVTTGDIQIGAIKKEVIGTWLEGSYIRDINLIYTIKRNLLLFVLNIRNSIKAYFS